MDSQGQIHDLKRRLLRDVAYLSRRSDLQWNNPIVETIRELRRAALPAVYFGGTLRSLLLGRLLGGRRIGRPRDLDIVVADVSMSSLRERLEQHIVRETRFGGLKIKRNAWHFDIWPLCQTWAFKEDTSLSASFAVLPQTTFFNLEAIAVDVWVKPGGRRQIYSCDDRFFEGMLNQTIELNRESNPYPALCVVRSLVMATSTRFWIGPRLAEFLMRARDQVSDGELDDIQRHHYGARRLHVTDMRRFLEHVAKTFDRAPGKVRPPLQEQLLLWDDSETALPRVNFHVFSSNQRPSHPPLPG